MKKTVIPRLLCNFGLVYKSELLSRMSIVKGKRSGYEEVTCQTLEIGDYLDFEFYDIVWWCDQPDKPNTIDDPRSLAYWLDISNRVGSDMSYLFITKTGNIVSKTSAKHVARDYYLKPDIESMVDDFNNKLTERLDDGNSRVNSYLDDKFDYILPGKDLSKNLGVNYDSGVTSTD